MICETRYRLLLSMKFGLEKKRKMDGGDPQTPSKAAYAAGLSIIQIQKWIIHSTFIQLRIC